MNKAINQEIYNYASDSGATLKKGLNSIEFLIDSSEGTSRVVIYTLLSGMLLTFYNINASDLPNSGGNRGSSPLLFKYCVSGRVELLLDDNAYIYLQDKDCCFSKQSSKGDSFFPVKSYQGMELFLIVIF